MTRHDGSADWIREMLMRSRFGVAGVVLGFWLFLGAGGPGAAPARAGEPAPTPTPTAGECCTAHSGVGCAETTCKNCICVIDPFCCSVVWDARCSQHAVEECAGSCTCGGPLPTPTPAESPTPAPTLGPPAPTATPVHGGSCCDPHIGVGCDEASCEDCVCTTDPYCCALEWDARCSQRVATQCAASCTSCGSNDACADATVVTPGGFDFSTLAATTDGPPLPAECEEGSGLTLVNDVWYRYTPPCGGPTTFDVCNLANYDTRLAVYTGSCGDLTLVACNDDAAGCSGLTSKLTFPNDCGVTYLIRLGGFAGSGSGSFNLSCDGGVCGPAPTPTPVHGGTCCDPHAGVGCDEAACEDCVCAADPYCCALQWDERCGQQAATSCDEICTTCTGATPTAVPDSFTLAGTVRYYVTGIAVPGAAVEVRGEPSGTLIASTTTASDGTFSVVAIAGADVALSVLPAPDQAPRVSALDAAYVLQSAAGRRSLTQVQRSVADVTADGAVGTADATTILRYRTGNLADLPSATRCGASWLFFPAPLVVENQTVMLPTPTLGESACAAGKIVYRPLVRSVAHQDFFAAALGDVTGNAQSVP